MSVKTELVPISINTFFHQPKTTSAQAAHGSVNGQTSLQAQQAASTTIAWASDIHFDHANESEIRGFFERLNAQKPDMLLLTGDIDLSKKNPPHPFDEESVIPSNGLIGTLKKIAAHVKCPVRFICGNHDFYFSSIKDVRAEACTFSKTQDKVSYVHETPGIELNPVL